jgi:hypothetical protein
MQMPNIEKLLTPQQLTFNDTVLSIYQHTSDKLNRKGTEHRKVLDSAIVRIFAAYVEGVQDGSDSPTHNRAERIADLYPSFRLAMSRLLNAYGNKPMTFGRDTKMPDISASVKRALRLFRTHQHELFPNQNELPYVQILLDKLL